VQPYTSDSNRKGAGNFPRSHFVKNHLNSSVTIFMMSVSSQKHHPFSADFIQVTGKNQLGVGQESMGDAPVFSCS
jgi:hypothetical protein